MYRLSNYQPPERERHVGELYMINHNVNLIMGSSVLGRSPLSYRAWIIVVVGSIQSGITVGYERTLNTKLRYLPPIEPPSCRCFFFFASSWSLPLFTYRLGWDYCQSQLLLCWLVRFALVDCTWGLTIVNRSANNCIYRKTAITQETSRVQS